MYTLGSLTSLNCQRAEQAYHSDIAEFVCTSHGVVIKEAGAGEPPGIGVIGEDNQLVLMPLVSHKVEAVLDV